MSKTPYLDNTRIYRKYISTDELINAMIGLKIAFERCNYLHTLIINNSNRNNIIDNKTNGSYATVLQPIIEKNYIENDDFFWIMNVATSLDEIPNSMYYFTWKSLAAWNNQTFSQIEQNASAGLPWYDLINGCKKNIPSNARIASLRPTESNHIRSVYAERWGDHVQLYHKIYTPDLLDSTKMIEIGSSINLGNYLSIDTGNDPSTVPIEFEDFLNSLNDVINSPIIYATNKETNGLIQFTTSTGATGATGASDSTGATGATGSTVDITNSIVNSDLIKKWSTDGNVFQYNPSGTADNTICLYSLGNPEFTGTPISKCIIPGSTVNYPAFIESMMNDLNDSYYNLSEGYVALLVFKGTDNRPHIALVFVLTLDNTLAWVYNTIDYGGIIQNVMDISGDVTIKGTLNIQTFDKQDIVCIDNISKIMTVFNKVGINQEASQVQGLLDIDNLSMNKLLSVLAEFENTQKECFYALQAMINAKTFNTNNDLDNIIMPEIVTPPSGLAEPVILRVPLKNIPLSTEIIKTSTYLSTTPSFLRNTTRGSYATLDTSSYNKLLRITNEINKMRPEIAGYQLTAGIDTTSTPGSSESDMIYTFVEILNDTNFYYLCSIRAIIKTYSTTTNGTPTFNDYIYFVISTLDITNIMIDESYSSDMEKVVKKISGANKYLNLTVLVAHQTSIYNNLFTASGTVTDTTHNWVQEYIKLNPYLYDNFGIENSELYSFCNLITGSETTIISNFTSSYDKNADYSKVIINGDNPVWVNKNTKDIYLESTDISLNELLYNCMAQTIRKYGVTMKLVHPVYYTWIKDGQIIKKMSVVCIYLINNVYYYFGCGFDLGNQIDNSIKLKGDSSFGGDITVRNANNDIIYKIDNVNETISNIYNVAIGKEIPTTKLDVKDSSTYDLVILIKELGKRINNMNFNKNIIQGSTDTISNTIENNLIDANAPGNTQYTNTSKNYYSLIKFIQNPPTPAPTNDDWGFVSDNFHLEYNYIMKDYWGTYFGGLMSIINNPQTTDAENMAFQNIKQTIQTTFIFNNSLNIDVVKWINGMKVILGQTYKTESSGNYHQIITGLDLQDYGLHFFSNSNISNFFNILKYCQNYLSVMVANLNHISLSPERYTLPFDKLNVDSRKYYSPNVFKFKMFTSTKNNQYLKSVVYNLSNPSYTPSPTSTLNNDYNDNSLNSATASFTPDLPYGSNPGTVYDYTDNNTMMKYQSLMLNIFDTYKTDLRPRCFNTGDYGLVTYEDSTKYFMGYIYCMFQYSDQAPTAENDISYVELLILEKPLTDIAIPSVLLGGDTEVLGEFVVTDKTKNAIGDIVNYTVIDPHNKFIGINTDERDIFYTYKFNTITNSNTIKQNMYVKNDKYPVAVFERLWESDITKFNYDTGKSSDPVYKDEFASFSALTVKRYSEAHNFSELEYYTNLTNNRYGVDIAFEMRNQYMESQEIGHVGMVIDKTVRDTNLTTFDYTIQAGFLVTATEITGTGSSEKELLYVSNSGDLSVNSIILPPRTETSTPSNTISVLPALPSAGQMVFFATGDEHYLYVCVTPSMTTTTGPDGTTTTSITTPAAPVTTLPGGVTSNTTTSSDGVTTTITTHPDGTITTSIITPHTWKRVLLSAIPSG